MNTGKLTILNIGIDRGLLSSVTTEVQERQLFYAKNLPALIIHIVKAPLSQSSSSLKLCESLEVFPCRVPHWIFFLPKSIALALKIAKTRNIDLIQTQDALLSGLAGLVISKLTGLPLAVGLYSDEIDNPIWLRESALNGLFNFIGKLVLGRANCIRTDSYDVLQRLKSYEFRNFHYIPFLITHADKFKALDSREADKIRRDMLQEKMGPLLLFVGRLEPEKNLPLLLKAFLDLQKLQPDATLMIIGSGSLSEHLKKLANDLCLKNIHWLGWVENTLMPSYYGAADLLLVSSDRESAARVLYESSLSGTAVLTTNTAGADEIIVDGISGRIVPIGQSREFIQALIDMCNDTEKLCALGENAKKIANLKISDQAVVASLKQLYEKALEG